ncbi:DUF2971 domain-containing protein [Massilia endophytica]|uniref:DUF2971 domain-containing protein n=1 Tax=Massilia endophytica TaxID=2899220 RepID=UPI001E5C77C6|nr:DUF2971 domain-containing protein [Massilia endophytica]UGQ49098.1 DUF2971 domain-containing protein [Massilia endophytica]
MEPHDAISRYRFLPAEALDQLQPGQIWMSGPATFNDPFDLRIRIADETQHSPFADEERLRRAFRLLVEDNEEVKKHWFYDEDLWQALHAWMEGRLPRDGVIEAANRRAACFGVACFAQHWNMPLMWSHYGSNHFGLCVEYAVQQDQLDAQAGKDGFGQHYVQYLTEMPTICFSEVLFSPHQVMSRLAATKHADWAYEKEWRIIHFAAKARPVPLPRHMRMTALIAGMQMDEAQCEAVRAKGRELGVPVRRIRKHSGDYQLELEDLD